jgi:hypothetical protein
LVHASETAAAAHLLLLNVGASVESEMGDSYAVAIQGTEAVCLNEIWALGASVKGGGKDLRFLVGSVRTSFASFKSLNIASALALSTFSPSTK